MTNLYTDDFGVFKNKLGITNAEELKNEEYELTSIRADEILSNKIFLNAYEHDLERLLIIHKHLFQDIYDWAGKIRTVSSSKRINHIVSRFAEPFEIEANWRELEKKISAFVANQNANFEEKRDVLADIFIEANRIHAFVEGNGRTLQVFMKMLAKEQKIELDYTKVNAQEWNLASALSCTNGRFFEHVHFIASAPNPEKIKKIFAKFALNLS